MQVLFAPWRMEYILGPKSGDCVFCLPERRDEDEARLVLARYRTCFVIMNKYPYNNGHLMVAPYRHVGSLAGLTPEEGHEIMDALKVCVDVLERSSRPQGINAGLNLGEAAGAGIAAHLHLQIVPRWNGDASFMAVMAETRVVPEHLLDTYRRLKPYFDAHPQL